MTDLDPQGVVVLLCTAPAEGADLLARTLVEERLCACVNLLGPVRSHYRWQGAVEAAEETMLVVKTTRSRCADFQRRFVELHPYEVPELLEVPIAGGLDAYLQWVASSVSVEAGPEVQ